MHPPSSTLSAPPGSGTFEPFEDAGSSHSISAPGPWPLPHSRDEHHLGERHDEGCSRALPPLRLRPQPPAPGAKTAPPRAATKAAAPTAATPAAPARSETLSADTPRTTQLGATFTAPRGWTVTSYGAKVLLRTPEPDSRLALVDLLATSADAAVAAAWDAFRPGRGARSSSPPRGQAATAGTSADLHVRDLAQRAARRLRRGAAQRSLDGGLVEATEPTYERRLASVDRARQPPPQGLPARVLRGQEGDPLDPQRIRLLKDFVASGERSSASPGWGSA